MRRGFALRGSTSSETRRTQKFKDGKTNVAQFEFILWLLGTCRDLKQARAAIASLNLVGTPFSAKLPSAQLHWMLADKTGCIVLESMADGLHVYENPVGVLTNNPPFPTRAVRPQQLRPALAEAAREPVLRGPFAANLFPRHGRDRPSGRSVVHVPLRPRGLYPAERKIGRRREGVCQSVFPHSDRRRADARLPASWKTGSSRSRSIRAAATQTKAFTTTRPMKTGRSRRSRSSKRI